jgi:DNA-binding XRE family transcriptional regulator
VNYKTMTLDGAEYVLIPRAEFELLSNGAPMLPPSDAAGNAPAVAYATASIARKLLRERLAVGMSQRDLAAAAGIRPEVLNRAERGAVIPSVRTLEKVQAALDRVLQERARPSPAQAKRVGRKRAVAVAGA